MRLSHRWQFSSLTAVLVLTGCAATNDIGPQSAIITPQQLQLSSSHQAAQLSLSAAWWTAFNDPQLNALMDGALRDSPTLKQAAARVREAQSAVGMANSLNGPNLDLNGSIRRDRFSQNTIQPFAPGAPSQPLYETTNQLGLNFSYEFDWWGKFRNQVNAASAQVDSLRAEQAQSTLTLTSALASAYYQLQSDFEMQKLLQQQEAASRTVAGIDRQQYQAGVVGAEVWQQAAAQAELSGQQLTQVTAQIEMLHHQIAALSGKGAGAAAAVRPVSLPAEDRLMPPAALTTDLLSQRPDITAQRALIESYGQSVQAARKDFYPSLSITAFAGLTTANFNGDNPTFFEEASRAWNFAPAISLPIFHAGALRSKLGQESALYDQAVELYNQTVLNAVQNAADAITQQQNAGRQYQQSRQASQAIAGAYRVAQEQYQSGMTGRLSVLNSQTQLLQQQQAELSVRNTLLQSRIDLIRSLGGGYNAPAAQPKA